MISVDELCFYFKGLRKGSEEGKIGRKLSDHKLNRRSDAEWMHLKPLNEGTWCSFVYSSHLERTHFLKLSPAEKCLLCHCDVFFSSRS